MIASHSWACPLSQSGSGMAGVCRGQVATLLQACLGVGQGLVENADVLLDPAKRIRRSEPDRQAAVIGPGSFQGFDGKGEVKMMTDRL